MNGYEASALMIRTARLLEKMESERSSFQEDWTHAWDTYNEAMEKLNEFKEQLSEMKIRYEVIAE